MNEWLMTFTRQIDYSAHDEITVIVDLVSGSLTASVDAKLDTGSKYCIFQPRYARWLKLDLTSGTPQRFSTATGSFLAYGHTVKLAVSGLEWETTVYFAESEDFPVNVVGRIGFLDHLQVGVVDYEQLLYLNAYEPHW